MPGLVSLLTRSPRTPRVAIVALILLLGAFGSGRFGDARSATTLDREGRPRHLITPTSEEISVTVPEPRVERVHDLGKHRSAWAAADTTEAPSSSASLFLSSVPVGSLGPGGYGASALGRYAAPRGPPTLSPV
jgi:hypothetical protein